MSQNNEIFYLPVIQHVFLSCLASVGKDFVLFSKRTGFSYLAMHKYHI